MSRTARVARAQSVGARGAGPRGAGARGRVAAARPDERRRAGARRLDGPRALSIRPGPAPPPGERPRASHNALSRPAAGLRRGPRARGVPHAAARGDRRRRGGLRGACRHLHPAPAAHAAQGAPPAATGPPSHRRAQSLRSPRSAPALTPQLSCAARGAALSLCVGMPRRQAEPRLLTLTAEEVEERLGESRTALAALFGGATDGELVKALAKFPVLLFLLPALDHGALREARRATIHEGLQIYQLATYLQQQQRPQPQLR
eukprot:scaffold4384_cov367-Prasinococcus_capsulatus_cf.AAC.5